MSSVKSEMIGLYCGMIGLYSENAISSGVSSKRH
jgi:hypothetical protein